jgi:protein polybromo-1
LTPDGKGRQLSIVFNKLPNTKDFRDYYEVIKNPISLEKIHLKIKQQQYNNLDELMGDIIMMCDNACKYNEPDSQIYKDALVLQKVALQKKIQLQVRCPSCVDTSVSILFLRPCIQNYKDGR